MTENNSLWRHPAVFFITRMFILLGMMMVFGGVAYSIALVSSKALFRVDFIANPELLNNFSDPAAIAALKYVQAISAIGLFIFPAWFFCRAINREPIDYLKLDRKINIREVLVALAIMICITPFISWLVYVNEKIQLPASMYELETTLKQTEALAARITEAFLNVSTFGGLISNLIVVALIAAVGEEFFFRGVLQTFIRNISGNAHFAVIFAAIVFSAFHAQFYGFLPRFVLGAVLGYAFLFTGNLWISILIHFTNNALAVVFSYQPFAHALPAELQTDYTFEAWYVNAVSALITLALLLLLRKITLKRVWYNGE